jgi:hypothetical protein
MMMGMAPVTDRAATFCRLRGRRFPEHEVEDNQVGEVARALFNASAPSPPSPPQSPPVQVGSTSRLLLAVIHHEDF